MRIFISATVTDGLIGAGGVEQADLLCQQDSNRPATGAYMALVVDSANRVALPEAQRRDWVLAANRTYVRPDGTVIGTTTSQAVFAFPLSASIGASAASAWTGVGGSGWVSGVHCQSWADAGNAAAGMIGQTDNLTSNAFSAASASCDTSYALYCVEQPEAD